MKITSSFVFTACLALMLGALTIGSLGTIAHATKEDKPPHLHSINDASDSPKVKPSKQDKEVAKEQAKAQKRERLNAKKLATCKKHASHVSSVMQDLDTRGSKQLAVFEKIATRTQEFVTTHQVSVANYDSLVAAVTATHSAAQNASANVQSVHHKWSCTSDGPKADIDNYKAAKKEEIAALKAYKDAVRALVLAVKSAASSGETH